MTEASLQLLEIASWWCASMNVGAELKRMHARLKRDPNAHARFRRLSMLYLGERSP